jgi:hypothetical protein
MAGKLLLANNAKGRLNVGILAGDLTLTLQAAQGALFPAPAGGDWFKATLIDGAGNIEIIYCTARAGDVFSTIARAQEGTIARAFNAADKVELRWTRDSANQFHQRTDIQRNIARFAGVAGGTADALTATLASDLKALQDGMRVDIEAALANATTTPTFNLTLGPAFDGTSTVIGALTIKKLAASALSAADIAGAGHRVMLEYRAADNAWYILNPAGALSRALLSVRHAIQAAKIDANGFNAAFAAGTGLAVDLSAAATPFNVSFANGFDSQGPFELVSQLTADAASAVASIAASNTTFLHATWSNISAVTWGKCLIPPQHGYAFDRTQAALLNFEAANGSTTFLDDFGNTWTPSGNAQITTAQSKFGTSSMLLDGTGDWISSTNFTGLGDGSWEISAWVRFNALPAAANHVIFGLGQAGGTNFGALLALNDTAGTKKLSMFISSDGTSNNVANGVLGTTTAWATNTWYKVRLVFDALAGSYKAFLSNNGAAETLEITVSSSLRVCVCSKFVIGSSPAGAGNEVNGWIDGFRLVRAATNTSLETPSASAPALSDFPVHFFSIPQMKMYEVTAAAPGAGSDPVFTQRNRVFAGEVDTGAAAVSAVRNYAIRGRHSGVWTTPLPGINTSVSVNTNIGTKECKTRLQVLALASSVAGYAEGDLIDDKIQGGSGTDPVQLNPMVSRNTAQFRTASINGMCVIDKSAGTLASIGGSGSWAYRMVTERIF